MVTSNVSDWQDVIDGSIELIELWGQAAELQTRAIKNPTLNTTDFDETFTKVQDIILAFDTDDNGKTTFDSVGIEQAKTHEGYFEYVSGVTSEYFILYNNRRFKIISIENIGELNGIYKVNLVELGSTSKEASKA